MKISNVNSGQAVSLFYTYNKLNWVCRCCKNTPVAMYDKIRVDSLTLSSIYTHLDTLKKKKKKKKLYENIVEKGEIAQHEQFHLFPQCFLCNVYLRILSMQCAMCILES